MLKKPKIKLLIIIISIIIIGGYFFINSSIRNQKLSNLTSFLNVEQKELIKKYFFPYKVISQQQQKIFQQQQKIFQQQQILKFVNLSALELEKKGKAVRL